MTRVLVVDDNQDNLYYLSALLVSDGCEVESAHHGAEALAKARQSPPDLVISDLLMPVMDGYSLLRHWKTDERLRAAPFIVYTATYTEPEDEQLALSLGADAFMLKPAEPAELLACVHSVLANTTETAPMLVTRPESDEEGLLRGYSEVLIRKLEKKTMELAESNRLLQKDNAARELSEMALRESEKRFRQLAENIDDVFWLSDPLEQKIFYVSPAYETIWGRSCKSLYDAPGSWLEAVPAEDRERVKQAQREQATSKLEQTYRIIRPDGSTRWIRSRSYPVRDEHGGVYRVAGVSRDITEYQRLEEQLRQAQKMEAVGRLAAGVAHDFNNLLSVILCYTKLALDELSADDPMRSDIEEVHRAGERATSLTQQLLAFSRQQMIQPRVLDLCQVVRDMDTLLQRVLGEDVELSLRTSRSSCRVYADPSQIEQIVMNLAVNARDAMPHGGKLTLEVAAVELDASHVARHPGAVPGRHIKLTVSDIGSGMDAGTIERIFEPFFTTKEKGKGTGLGLSTVFGIVRQGGGHLEVHSELGRGTCFEIYLPSTDREVELGQSMKPTPATLRGSETVLLVEDDRQVREMTRAILQRNGYQVLDAQNGGEAMLSSELFADPIQLLITDVVMPRMSGPELAARLGSKRPEMKVLYVSGYAENAVVVHGVLAPGITFLQKPITPDTLLGKVRELLSVET